MVACLLKYLTISQSKTIFNILLKKTKTKKEIEENERKRLG